LPIIIIVYAIKCSNDNSYFLILFSERAEGLKSFNNFG